LRQFLYAEPFYRLVYGDSDFLPGVVVDRFGDYLSVQISSAGMEYARDALVDALQMTLEPRGILLRNDHGARQLESLPEYQHSIGQVPEQFSVKENGTEFTVAARAGQKTGWFYDHRENRQRLQRYCRERSVLDVFSYVGGWGIQAAVAGAREVICVDASAAALELAGVNAGRNACDDRVSGIQGKAIDVLKLLVDEGRKFDIVVLDPPAFIKRRKDQKAGAAAYRHINELALRLLAPGGLLVSASCSMHLAADALTDIVRGAAQHIDRDLQLLYSGGQSPDHPVHPSIPETRYLKAHFYRALPR
jgi:23S rRNA (cytosine1962-C5)-methyltransferase